MKIKAQKVLGIVLIIVLSLLLIVSVIYITHLKSEINKTEITEVENIRKNTEAEYESKNNQLTPTESPESKSEGTLSEAKESHEEEKEIFDSFLEGVREQEETNQEQVDSAIEKGDNITLKYETREWTKNKTHYVAIIITPEQYIEDSSVRVLLNFKDREGNLLDYVEGDINVITKETTMCVILHTEEEYHSFECELLQDSTFYEPVIQNLEYKKTITEDKVIVQVTNTGKLEAEFVNVIALFKKDGVVIDYDTSYATDNDYEIKGGKTETTKLSSYEKFDDVEIYLEGRYYD